MKGYRFFSNFPDRIILNCHFYGRVILNYLFSIIRCSFYFNACHPENLSCIRLLWSMPNLISFPEAPNRQYISVSIFLFRKTTLISLRHLKHSFLMLKHQVIAWDILTLMYLSYNVRKISLLYSPFI